MKTKLRRTQCSGLDTDSNPCERDENHVDRHGPWGERDVCPNLFPDEDQSEVDIQPGWWVAIHTDPTHPGFTPCHVGEVQSVTDRGVRITHVDWLTGQPDGMDYWFPWARIKEMTVATHRHYLSSHDWGAEQTRAKRAYDGAKVAPGSRVSEKPL